MELLDGRWIQQILKVSKKIKLRAVVVLSIPSGKGGTERYFGCGSANEARSCFVGVA